jgi:hypothetical protein
MSGNRIEGMKRDPLAEKKNTPAADLIAIPNYEVAQ